MMPEFDVSVFKQTRDYNCAAGAVSYFVWAHSGLVLNVETVTRKLGCDPETGTTYSSVVGYLDYLFRYDGIHLVHGHNTELHEFTLPMIVRYWDEDETHYGVVTELSITQNTGSSLFMYDPWVGEGVVKDWEEFVSNWYTPLYGKHWGLYIARKGN
jgi:hypothetical protein